MSSNDGGGNDNNQLVNGRNIGADIQGMSVILAELVKNLQKKPMSEEKDQAKMFHQIASMKPKIFDRRSDPVVFEEWLRAMEKLFIVVGCPAHRKVGYAVYYLEGRADTWWHTVKERAEDPEFGWKELKELMRKEFFPPSLRRQKEEEFLQLKQEKMSVLEYASKFMELARFAPHLVDTEERKMEKFERGLTWDLQDRLSTHSCTTYQQLYDKAVNAARVLGQKTQDQGDNKRKADNRSDQHKSPFKKHYSEHSASLNSASKQPYRGPPCGKCRRPGHPTRECRVGTNLCLWCASPEHTVKDCQVKARTKVQGGSSSYNNSGRRNYNNSNNGHDGDHRRNGHYNHQQRGVNPSGAITGRVNVMNQQEAQDAGTVITGSDLLYDHPS